MTAREYITASEAFQLPADLPVRIPRLEARPLVVLLLAAADAELHLGEASLVEEDAQRHDRQPLLVDAALELLDLRAMEEQLTPSERLVPERRGAPVLRDVTVA